MGTGEDNASGWTDRHILLGIGLVVIGLIVGFSAMFMDYDNQARMLIGLVPIGFVLLLAGTVATQLSPPKDK